MGGLVMKISSLVLAGLFVAALTASASADWTPQKMAEMKAKRKSGGYAGCTDTLHELGWNSLESWVGCSARHNHVFFVNRMVPAKEPFPK
jgi:hypothetical protein